MFKAIFSFLQQLIRTRSFPVSVTINQEIPIKLLDTGNIPLDTQIRIDLENFVDIEVEIPVRAEIPVSTVIETEILKYGKVKIPIKALIPVSLVIPVSARAKVRLKDVPVNVKENIRISIPNLTVPVNTSMTTNISLWPLSKPTPQLPVSPNVS